MAYGHPTVSEHNLVSADKVERSGRRVSFPSFVYFDFLDRPIQVSDVVGRGRESQEAQRQLSASSKEAGAMKG
jgi:hypothetical protein